QPEHRDLPPVRRAQPLYALDRGGLPRAVRPEDPEDLPLLDGERHVVDGDRAAVPLVQVADIDDRHLRVPLLDVDASRIPRRPGSPNRPASDAAARPRWIPPIHRSVDVARRNP